MLNPFFTYLETIRPLSAELKERLTNDLEIIEVPKKQLLLRDGERADYLYVVLKGMLRSYYIREDVEICNRFMKEYHIVVSVNSFYKRRAGYEFIEAMENSTLARIHYNALQELYKDFIDFNYTARVLTEHYFSSSEERLYLLRKQKAEDRYLYFIENYPDLLNRVPLGNIASFLGMNLETLSRIRSKLKKG
ncbi:MAG TPA: Crp/Fnr family transcriptional regulator [Chitinophagaceae bacterium]|nr:Crp/Fnr family transcriptional regulator [Chitinophagaceae bacterium]